MHQYIRTSSKTAVDRKEHIRVTTTKASAFSLATSAQTSYSATWNELLIVVVMEVLVARKCREEGRLVPDLRQFSVIAPQLMRTVSIRCSCMNAGWRIADWHMTDWIEVDRCNACQLRQSSVQLLLILHSEVRRGRLTRP